MKLGLLTSFGCALAVASAGCATAKEKTVQDYSQSSTADRLPGEGAIEKLLRNFDVPGLALATLSSCDVDGVRTYGFAQPETGAKVTPQTAFEAASLSKPVFAYLVLELADEGIIDLDAPLAPFDYPRITDTDAYGKLTPRMILTHRTGLPNWSGDSQEEDRADTIPFENAPGTAYSYSGEAFELLRAFVVAKTGLSLQELFLERLGEIMPNSSFDGQLRGRAVSSRAYRSARDPESGRDLYLVPHDTGAAWGLVTTAGDYAAFLSQVCKARTLSAEMHADMLRPQSPVPRDQAIGPTSYGLAWAILQLGQETIAMHSGNNDEYRTFAAFLPETGEGYVLLTNGQNGEDMIGAIMEETAP